jgi:hypothetical protein
MNRLISILCAQCLAICAYAQTPVTCAAAFTTPSGLATIGELVLKPETQQQVAQSGLLASVAQSLTVSAEWITSAGLEMHLYPNPALQHVTLHIAGDYNGAGTIHAGMLRVYSQTGQLAMQHALTSTDLTVSVAHLPVGAYTVVVYDVTQRPVYQAQLLKQN